MHQNENLTFRKSSYSATQNDCVEVAETFGGAAVRDTQHRGHGHLEFTATEWRALLDAVRK